MSRKISITNRMKFKELIKKKKINLRFNISVLSIYYINSKKLIIL